jgi:hypothetical protein
MMQYSGCPVVHPAKISDFGFRADDVIKRLAISRNVLPEELEGAQT